MLDDDKAESTPGSKTMPKSAETRPAATRVNHGLETNSVGDFSFRSHEHQFVIASALRNLDLRPSRIDMISRIIAGLRTSIIVTTKFSLSCRVNFGEEEHNYPLN